jgi:hypothetical protein
VYGDEHGPYRLVRAGYSIGERYAKGEIDAHFHIASSWMGKPAEARQFCAIFQPAEVRFSDQLDNPTRQVDLPETGPGEIKRSMLVYVGQDLQDFELIPFIRVPSCVRLRPFQECSLCWRYTTTTAGESSQTEQGR